MERTLVPPLSDSPLALSEISLAEGERADVLDPDADSLLYVAAGGGTVAGPAGSAGLEPGAAALVLAGERALLEAGPEGLSVLRATVGAEAERHAPLGPRALVAPPGEAEEATGARSYRLLLGPHNGSTRATLFAGFVPPGRAPWHYHLYDEIVWVPEGPGRLHLDEGVHELGAGGAFRLRPRQLHIVENAGAAVMTVIGVFTPAGSPSAAYLPPGAEGAYPAAGA